MITLYHCSFLSVEKPLVGVGRRELDFGPGFYVTPLHEQAERWARRVCTIRALDTPTITTYQFDDDALPDGIRRLVFEQYDIDWLEFVVNSRKGLSPWEDYDIIEGGVANDKVIDTVEDYFSGRLTGEQAIGLLKFAKPTYQICIRRQNIVDSCLHYVNSELIPLTKVQR
jgi:hypothetical protein